MTLRALTLALVCLVSATGATAQRPVDAIIDRDLPSLVRTYKALHAAPELSTREEKTSAFVAGELRKMGYEVTERVGRYTDPALVGQWGNLMTWPAVSVHAAMMPSGKVLFWEYHGQTQLWDRLTNTMTDVSDPTFNAFCAGHAFLADGRLLVVGGHIANGVGLPNAAVYDAATDTWTNLPAMNRGRWYPNATTLGEGDVSVSGGTGGASQNVPVLSGRQERMPPRRQMPTPLLKQEAPTMKSSSMSPSQSLSRPSHSSVGTAQPQG
jgi:hypothetical protein